MLLLKQQTKIFKNEEVLSENRSYQKRRIQKRNQLDTSSWFLFY